MRISSKVMIAIIRFYQLLISPYLGNHCRFSPSCSQYATDAFKRYPFLKALVLTTKRIGRCHPWHPGGYDPVP